MSNMRYLKKTSMILGFAVLAAGCNQGSQFSAVKAPSSSGSSASSSSSADSTDGQGDAATTPPSTPAPNPVATPTPAVPTPTATPKTNPTPTATPVLNPTPIPTPKATPTPAATPIPTPIATPVATPIPTPPTTPLVPVTVSGFGKLSAENNRLFGPGACVMDSLWNSDIGNGNKIASQRFLATEAGVITSFRTYFVAGPGYAKGNGGKIRIRLFPDDGNLKPNMSGNPLGTATHLPKLNNGVMQATKWNDLVTMNSQTALVVGQIYHLVYDNIDPQEKDNYVGLNSAATSLEHGRACRWLNPKDWGFLRSQSSLALTDMSIKAATSGYFSPILQLTLNTGKSFGLSNMESGNTPDRWFSARKGNSIRERFFPMENKIVTAVSFQTGSMSAGSLNWEIKDGNTVLASGQVTEASASLKTSDSIQTNRQQGVFKWYDIPLNSSITLVAGKTYDLTFTPADNSEWVFTVHRNGGDYSFVWPAAYTQSQAEHFYNGQWLKAYIWNHAESSGFSNWRVVLHTK